MYNLPFFGKRIAHVLTIYHNPRCSKSRQTLQIIQDAGAEVEVVEYLKTPLDKKALKSLTKKLSMSVRDIVRTSEAAYKEQNLKDDTLTESERHWLSD